MIRWASVLILVWILGFGHAFAQDGGAAPEALQRRGTTRIEFDPRAVEGQTKKSGGIYLFQRKEAEIKSLVKRKRSFRAEIFEKLDE